ncbi:unnamed protein product [Cyclocybe aegerita]|uniref:Deacetylase sirtuin-type domain-containing protein n=1 Tax=Cyclocybe aegerita TaxID=1973307 RepID=A0A8S0WA93_CYCAE|nr:unnamed protein product [Cyclocybe aegerita]
MTHEFPRLPVVGKRPRTCSFLLTSKYVPREVSLVRFFDHRGFCPEQHVIYDNGMSSYRGHDHRSIYSGKPQTLEGRDLTSLAKYIKSSDCGKVILMLGAGVSTSAGIPDFRSPETGLYSNLARLNLPHPEAVFEINFFRRNPVPFYTLAHELYPGRFRPTITHSFIRLLAEKELLHTCFTQNIDTLERRAGVPEDKIIEAHGSFATQRCIECNASYDDEKMKDHIFRKQIAKCNKCGGYVKPDIVFFGEDLPLNFKLAVPHLRTADLLIVMGTSLTVHPFASLAQMVDKTCPRVLINLDHVGDFGARTDDVILLGKCDDVVRMLCKELGWEEELLALWNETEASVVPDIPVPPSQKQESEAKAEEQGKRNSLAALEAIEARLARLKVDEVVEPLREAEPVQEASATNATDKLSPTPSAVTNDRSETEKGSQQASPSKDQADNEIPPPPPPEPLKEGKL